MSLKGKRVLLTGHTGFMGSWLTTLLHARGAEVHGFALDPSTDPSLFERARVSRLLASDTRGDVRDAAAVLAAAAKVEPDLVLHLAAQPLVRLAYREPAATFATNVVGTAHVLDAVRATGRRMVVIVASSDKCYEPNAEGRPHRETDPLGGHEPYAASKAGTELVVAAYREAYFPTNKLSHHGIQLASVRAGNVVGGGDWAADRIVPDAARAAAAGRALVIRMPEAVRPWQHVLDAVGGYVALAERMLTDEAPAWCRGWNFGPDDGGVATVGDIVTRFNRSWPGAAHRVERDPTAPRETHLLRLDVSQTRDKLGWRPRWGWEEAIDRSAAWYRDAAGADAASACARDLAAWRVNVPGDAASVAGIS